MKQYISKSAIKAEIERRKQTWQHQDQQYVNGGKDVCDYLLGFLDTLEVKEVKEESVSDDLEEAARKAATWYSRVQGDIFFENDYQKFIAGAKWCRNQAKVEILANSMAVAHGCPKEPVSEDLEEEIHRYYVDWDEHPQYVQTARHFANWQKENLWKNAQGDDLPEIDREVIVLYQPYPCEGNEYVVSFAHRPNPNGWDGKNVITGKVEHYTPKTYDKGGWSIPNVVWWLDLDLPIKGE